MWILRYVIDAAIPALAAYFAVDDTFVKWLIEKHLLSLSFNIQAFQKVCIAINIFFTVFILSFKLIYHKHKGDYYRKEIAGLYNVIKEFARNNFAQISGDKNFSFDLRVFVPEISILRSLTSWLPQQKKEKWFVIRNIEPFAKRDITEHLRFRVKPDKQGLVGDAYETGSIVYDDMLEVTNDKKYSLEQTQLSRTGNLLWSLCVPVSNDKNEVIAVMAFDSDCSDLSIEENKDEIRTLTNTLTIMMKDSVPELFKKKWSIR